MPSGPPTGADDADDDTSPRLESYVARTRDVLDLLALLTLWIVVIPVSSFGPGEDATVGGLAVRLAVSLVYAVDLGIRAHLAPHGLRYVWRHPLAVLAVVLPPVRVLFSLRLVTSLFRRGNLGRFLAAASILLLDGILVVYFLERDAAGAQITTLGQAMWWGAVTVTTVGYGDLVPVTAAGRFVAVAVMVLGLLTLAVVTAQVSSTFNEQYARRREAGAVADDGGDRSAGAVGGGDPGRGVGVDRSVEELHRRLDRIEAALTRDRPPTD